MARPAKRPASPAEPPGVHEPVCSATSMPIPAPDGPTKMRSAASRTSRDAAAFSMISGPIPRTSPRVTASRALRSTFTPESGLLGFLRFGHFGGLAVQRVVANRDVRLLLQHVDVSPYAAAIGEIGPHRGFQLVERLRPT